MPGVGLAYDSHNLAQRKDKSLNLQQENFEKRLNAIWLITKICIRAQDESQDKRFEQFSNFECWLKILFGPLLVNAAILVLLQKVFKGNAPCIDRRRCLASGPNPRQSHFQILMCFPLLAESLLQLSLLSLFCSDSSSKYWSRPHYRHNPPG